MKSTIRKKEGGCTRVQVAMVILVLFHQYLHLLYFCSFCQNVLDLSFLHSSEAWSARYQSNSASNENPVPITNPAQQAKICITCLHLLSKLHTDQDFDYLLFNAASNAFRECLTKYQAYRISGVVRQKGRHIQLAFDFTSDFSSYHFMIYTLYSYTINPGTKVV